MRALKFQGKRAHARRLRTLLARERLGERGHNQAAELAHFAVRTERADDVITTGTAGAAAGALGAAGASGIELWVLARAVRHQPARPV